MRGDMHGQASAPEGRVDAGGGASMAGIVPRAAGPRAGPAANHAAAVTRGSDAAYPDDATASAHRLGRLARRAGAVDLPVRDLVDPAVAGAGELYPPRRIAVAGRRRGDAAPGRRADGRSVDQGGVRHPRRRQRRAAPRWLGRVGPDSRAEHRGRRAEAPGDHRANHRNPGARHAGAVSRGAGRAAATAAPARSVERARRRAGAAAGGRHSGPRRPAVAAGRRGRSPAT